jgi:hypothetical protein
MTELVVPTTNEILQDIADNMAASAGTPGVAVANLAASTNLGIAGPVAAVVAVGAPTAVVLNATFSNTEVEAGLLGKADQADVVTAVAALVAAINLKTDHTAYTAQQAILETRLDNLEAKVNSLLTSLRNSDQIAP